MSDAGKTHPEYIQFPRLGAHIRAWSGGHSCTADHPVSEPCICKCGVPAPYLTTTPGTRVEFITSKPWCAGHAWRRKRGLGWLHRLGHRARLLRAQPPSPMEYIR